MKKLLYFLLFITNTRHIVNHDISSCDSIISPFRNKKICAQFLQKEGFEKYYVTTEDNYTLEVLFLKRSYAQTTLLVCSGLGYSKEKMATIYPIFPLDCNVIFFDARRHGNSSGSFLYKPWQYGLYDYKDIIALLDFIHTNTDITIPIIIYGNCAGGFNALHALIELQKRKKFEQYIIKGFIFDSGWASRIQACHTVMYAKIHCTIQKIIHMLLGNTHAKRLNKSFISSFFKHVTQTVLYIVHASICKPFLLTTESRTSLYDKIGKLPIPILFIHSLDDRWVDFKNIYVLAQKAQNALCWWIKEPSRHSRHHLIHTALYKKNFFIFYDTIRTIKMYD